MENVPGALVLNSQRNDKFIKSAKIFANLIYSENSEKYNYMYNFDCKDLDLYRLEETEVLETAL